MNPIGSIRDMEATRDPELRRRLAAARAGKLEGETPETVLEAYQLARSGKCGLIVRINGRSYKTRISPADQARPRTIRLRNDRGAVYIVTDEPTGPRCTCPDHGRGSRCKHIGSVKACGLI